MDTTSSLGPGASVVSGQFMATSSAVNRNGKVSNPGYTHSMLLAVFHNVKPLTKVVWQF